MNFRFNFSPYKVDENYVRLDEYCLPRMTFASVSTNFSITEKDFMKKKEGDSDPKVDKTKSDSEGDYDKDGYMPRSGIFRSVIRILTARLPSIRWSPIR